MKQYITRLIVIVCLLTLALSGSIRADGNGAATKEEIKQKLIPQISSSFAGTKFFLTCIPYWETMNSTFRIYIASAYETEVTLKIEHYDFEQKITTKSNGVVDYIFTSQLVSIYQKNDDEPPRHEELYEKRAVIIESDDPIVCYGIADESYSSEGFLIIPNHLLGMEYIAACYNHSYDKDETKYLTPYINVVSPYDNTSVYITYGGNYTTTTAGGTKMNETDTLLMSRGDVWNVGGIGERADLTGTYIRADKPVGVISGNLCASIPSNTYPCDFIVEQNMPMETWGKTYHYAPIMTRDSNSILRIFAKEPNTTIYRDGEEIGTIKRMGGTYEDGGWLEVRGAEGHSKTATYTSNKPFSITQYNTAHNDDGVEFDPFQMLLLPEEQYQREILFSTPGIPDGAGFKHNYVNLIHLADENQELPDYLLWGTVSDGKVTWNKLKDIFPEATQPYEYMLDGEKQYLLKSFKLPSDGVYAIKSDEPFVAYLYGRNAFSGYGFPLAYAASSSDVQDTLPPVAEFTQDCNGNIKGKIIDEPRDNEQERSNLGNISFDQDESYNYRYSREDFIPGEDATIEFEIDIIDPRFPACAKLYFVDKAGNRGDTTICYTPVKFQIRARDKELGEKVNFGTFKPTDPPKTLPFLVESLEESQTVLVTEVMLYSEDASKEPDNASFGPGFKMSGMNLPFQLGPGERAEFFVTFDPSKVGEQRRVFRDSIAVADTCVSFYTQLVEATVQTNVSVRLGDASGVSTCKLYPVSPNPISEVGGNVRFSVSIETDVLLTLVDMSSKQWTLLKSRLQPGTYEVELPISSLGSGAYVLQLDAGKDSDSKKFVITK